MSEAAPNGTFILDPEKGTPERRGYIFDKKYTLGNGRKFRLKAANVEEAMEWIADIRYCCAKTELPVTASSAIKGRRRSVTSTT